MENKLIKSLGSICKLLFYLFIFASSYNCFGQYDPKNPYNIDRNAIGELMEIQSRKGTVPESWYQMNDNYYNKLINDPCNKALMAEAIAHSNKVDINTLSTESRNKHENYLVNLAQTKLVEFEKIYSAKCNGQSSANINNNSSSANVSSDSQQLENVNNLGQSFVRNQNASTANFGDGLNNVDNSKIKINQDDLDVVARAKPQISGNLKDGLNQNYNDDNDYSDDNDIVNASNNPNNEIEKTELNMSIAEKDLNSDIYSKAFSNMFVDNVYENTLGIIDDITNEKFDEISGGVMSTFEAGMNKLNEIKENFSKAENIYNGFQSGDVNEEMAKSIFQGSLPISNYNRETTVPIIINAKNSVNDFLSADLTEETSAGEKLFIDLTPNASETIHESLNEVGDKFVKTMGMVGTIGSYAVYAGMAGASVVSAPALLVGAAFYYGWNYYK
jgi:hypothetical protein